MEMASHRLISSKRQEMPEIDNAAGKNRVKKGSVGPIPEGKVLFKEMVGNCANNKQRCREPKKSA